MSKQWTLEWKYTRVSTYSKQFKLVDFVCNLWHYLSVGSCYSTTVTGIIVGVVTFIIGTALGILLTFLILGIYSHYRHKPSLHDPVHVRVPATQSHQLSLEYQDVTLKLAPRSTIPLTPNTAYGQGERALGKGTQHKERSIELKENAANVCT